MAVATAISRVTGFVRTLAVVAALGLGTRLLDAYTAANVTPNTVYELVMGGALASVLVPLLVRTAADDRIDADLFAQRLLSLVVYGLSIVVIVTIIAAPFIVDLYVPGFTPAQRHLAVVFTRYFMPQILFYGVSATLAAVLNARGRFAAYQIMLRVFYALGDTRTPALLSVTVSAGTIATCLTAARVIHGPNLVIALAACSAIAYTAGLLLTAQLLRRRIGRLDGHRLLHSHARMFTAASLAAPATAGTAWAVGAATGTTWTASLVTITAAAAAGGILYALIARALRISEFKAVTATLRIHNS